jgi:ribulose-phosphate 3-epimerase
VGVALNPATPPGVLEHVLGDLDVVLVMTVNPGFSGQSLVESALPKIGAVKRLARKSKARVRIAVDGHVSERTAPQMVAQGATVLVGGRSGVFRPDLPPAEALVRLRRALEGHRARAQRPSGGDAGRPARRV